MASNFRRNGNRFSLAVDQFADLGADQMVKLVRQSVQDVINEAQAPVEKGGRMRVDTGFLRASGQASLTGMPTGPVRGELTTKNAYPSPEKYTVTASIVSSIAQMTLGSTFYFGWSAKYAIYREIYDGFLEGALMDWGQTVTYNVNKLRTGATKVAANYYQNGG